MSNLGRPGVRQRVGWRDGDARRHHDSKMSQRLAMVSAWEWEMLVGGGALERAPATTCNPWMILSSVDGAGIERYLW